MNDNPPLAGTAVFCAPFAPPERTAHGHLGSANKIASVARILGRLYRHVILINSAHNETGAWSIGRGRHHTELGTPLHEVIPPLLPWRPAGKALNLLQARTCLGMLGVDPPACIWTYNAYAFDGRMALLLKQRNPQARLVVEIEDWPGARKRRGLGWLKDRLDAASLTKAIASADLVTTVNASIAALPDLAGRRVLHLPSILHPGLRAAAAQAQIERSAIGYFGGMNVEKGFAVVLEALESVFAGGAMPERRFILCGTGPLLDNARRLADRHRAVSVFSGVDHGTLYQLMTSCAAVLNPHRPLPSDGGSGIFPFKIIEGIAAGCRVVSTSFPDPGLDLSAGIVPFDGTAGALAKILADPTPPPDARLHELQLAVLARFSEDAVAGSIAGSLSEAAA